MHRCNFFNTLIQCYNSRHLKIPLYRIKAATPSAKTPSARVD